jgi:hypothetical protein
LKHSQSRRAGGKSVRVIASISVGLFLCWIFFHFHKAADEHSPVIASGDIAETSSVRTLQHFTPSVLAPGQILQQGPGNADPGIPRHDWLALIWKDRQWSLVPSDVDLQESTVMATDPDTVLFVRGQGLTAGVVTSLEGVSSETGIDKDMSDSHMKFPFNGELHDLHLDKEGQLILSDRYGQHSTVLDGSKLIAVRLAWAGDLDHDGKLDLALRLENENESVVCLFLSTGTREGQLVRHAGCSQPHGPDPG